MPGDADFIGAVSRETTESPRVTPETSASTPPRGVMRSILLPGVWTPAGMEIRVVAIRASTTAIQATSCRLCPVTAATMTGTAVWMSAMSGASRLIGPIARAA